MKQIPKQRQYLQEKKNLYFQEYSTKLQLHEKLFAFLKTLIEFWIIEIFSSVIVSWILKYLKVNRNSWYVGLKIQNNLNLRFYLYSDTRSCILINSCQRFLRSLRNPSLGNSNNSPEMSVNIYYHMRRISTEATPIWHSSQTQKYDRCI